MKKRCMSILLAVAMTVSLCLTPADVCATEIAPPEEESAIAEEPMVSENETERGQWNEAGDILTLLAEELSAEELALAQQSSLQTEASVTESSVYNAMVALKSTYYEGMPWTNANPSGGYRFYGYFAAERKIMVGYGCAAFAYILSDAAFNDLPARDNYTFDWNKLCVGDILRINNNSHSVIILEKYADYIIVAEGNYNSSIHWGRKITKTQLQNTFTYQTTRYPNGYTPTTPITPAQEKQINNFVTRLYNKCLDRSPDAAGFADWTSKLKSGSLDGATAAYGFVFSREMERKNLSNEDYVETLYNVFMDRPSDAAGKADWVYKLNNGVSRYGVFMGFANSAEFSRVCGAYGITRGTAKPKEGRDRNLGLTTYVSRLYTKALGRQYEIAGLNDWCNRICDGQWSVTDVSTSGFFHSREFLNKNMSNDEYVKTLYRTFFDREYDQAGYDDWMNRLANGASRDDIIKGFAGSREFQDLKKSYGLR